MEKTINITPISTLLTFLKSVKKYNLNVNGYTHLGTMGVKVKSAFCSILEIEEHDLFGTLNEYLSLITLVKKQVTTNFKK